MINTQSAGARAMGLAVKVPDHKLKTVKKAGLVLIDRMLGPKAMRRLRVKNRYPVFSSFQIIACEGSMGKAVACKFVSIRFDRRKKLMRSEPEAFDRKYPLCALLSLMASLRNDEMGRPS